jgi:hypothetical protein
LKAFHLKDKLPKMRRINLFIWKSISLSKENFK